MQNVIINDVTLPVLEVSGQRVMTCADIDRVHGRKRGTASARFQANKRHFVLGTDYFVFTNKELNRGLMAENVIKGNPNFKTVLITKSGYLMLVKSLNDEKAWEVQRRLVDHYFITQNVTAQAPAVEKEDIYRLLVSAIDNQNKLIEAMMGLIAEIKKPVEVKTEPSKIETKTELPKLEAKVELPKPEPPKAKVKVTRRNIDYSLVPEEYKKWKEDLNVMLKGYDRSTVIKAACDKLHRVYGVSWTEERTMFHRQYERFPIDGNLELAFNIEQRPNWQNIFVNAVCDVAGEFEKASVPYEYPAKTMNDVRGIVRTIADKRNDASTHGNHVYNHIFSCFKKDTGFDMEEADQKYREAKKFGKNMKVKRIDVIDFACREQFINWFNTFAKKEFKELEEIK